MRKYGKYIYCAICVILILTGMFYTKKIEDAYQGKIQQETGTVMEKWEEWVSQGIPQENGHTEYYVKAQIGGNEVQISCAEEVYDTFQEGEEGVFYTSDLTEKYYGSQEQLIRTESPNGLSMVAAMAGAIGLTMFFMIKLLFHCKKKREKE